MSQNCELGLGDRLSNIIYRYIFKTQIWFREFGMLLFIESYIEVHFIIFQLLTLSSLVCAAGEGRGNSQRNSSLIKQEIKPYFYSGC